MSYELEHNNLLSTETPTNVPKIVNF